ncbi:Retrovirus-related Pol polyprotein from transposon opus [Labeo rohita]|uniref:Retrovirus-related Pol polyprotein from transposon opus n=1 Tax=Labeo rohita TaxID=84645 RepID=A0ABQ8MV34_LABRO|nr:Retrovirus-related Pol polyprotein from transposon opus [Labeo rohita]
MVNTHRARKQWCLTKVETMNSFENCRQNLVYTLSLDPEFAPFLVDGARWEKKTRASPFRGFTDDDTDVPAAQWRTCQQKIIMLELMLGQIAIYCPKSNGGFRLVTAFADVGRYSKPQPSLMPNADATLRLIAQWRYIIATDLTKAFYQIPLSKSSMKYCGVVTPFKGVRVYARCAMGMPGSEAALEELTCRILGDLLEKGRVAKIADDLYCGADTLEDLLVVWKQVLVALQGTIRASSHRIATLASCPVCQVCSFVCESWVSVVCRTDVADILRGAQKLRLVVGRYFYTLDLDSAIQLTSKGCHQCAALARSPVFAVEQSSCNPPETVGSTFAADVLKRERQLILVVHECVSSFIVALLIDDEWKESLRDGIVRLCIGLRPLDGPFTVVRTDPAPGFSALAKDTVLAQYRLAIEVGNAKNVNKNPVAEKAIQELQGEILRLEPHCGVVTPLLLSVAVARLNSRISAHEMLLQRDQFSLEQLPVHDQELIALQHSQRLANHPHSVKAKAPLSRHAPVPDIYPGDLVYLYSDRNKSQV